MMIAIYDSFHIPFIIGFQTLYSEQEEYEINDALIILIYLLDILISFRTTYIESISGVEVFEFRKIAIDYLKSYRFYLDLLAFIPFNKIFWGTTTYIQRQFIASIRMLKIYRLQRFTTLIQKLNVSRASKAVLKILFLIYFLMLFIHI